MCVTMESLCAAYVYGAWSFPQRRRRQSSSMGRSSFFEVKVLDAKTKQQLCFLDKLEPSSTVGDIKSRLHKSNPNWYPARQALKLHPKKKTLRDNEILQNLMVGTAVTIYFRDLGPQIGWTIVFFAECIGPLVSYLLFYFQILYIYSDRSALTASPHPNVTDLQQIYRYLLSWIHVLACACHTFHYIKKLMEMVFVHRFSSGTMPLRSTVKNCAYYWGFSAWYAYYINHPLYTPPVYGEVQVNCALAAFVMCELGNFSTHLTLSGLIGHGPKSKCFPVPNKNPFTWLFFLVSCPNYTYEAGAWVSFAVMTQCFPVALYALLAFIQMSIWAKGKHRAYSKDFKDYPRLRMAIIPLIL